MRCAEISRVRSKGIAPGRALRTAALLCCVFAVAAMTPLGAAEGGEWTVYAGRWAVEKEGTASELGFEFQRPFRETPFSIVGGLAGTDDEAIWAYAGVSWSWEPGEKWRLRPGFAISAFDKGDGKDLGGVVEFRSSLEATVLVRSNLRLGLLVHHLSNAGIYDLNPGSNSVVFVVGFP